MRTATEHLQREAANSDAELGLLDGIQLRRAGGWVQLLPDADEPVFHVYAEGADRQESEGLAEGFLEVVRGVIRDNAG